VLRRIQVPDVGSCHAGISATIRGRRRDLWQLNHRLKYQGLRFFRFCRFHTKIERESKAYESIGFRNCKLFQPLIAARWEAIPWSKRDQEEPLPPAERFSVDNNWRCNMFKSLDIQKDMEVVGLDGKHVGTVDHLETADRIILSKDDPKAGGRHHLISIEWVDYVDQKVHLNKPSMKATKEWQVAA
jgi:hypothetical protein